MNAKRVAEVRQAIADSRRRGLIGQELMLPFRGSILTLDEVEDLLRERESLYRRIGKQRVELKHLRREFGVR